MPQCACAPRRRAPTEEGDRRDDQEGDPPHARGAARSGKDARARTPRSSLEGWAPADDRPDPVALLEAQNETREPDLVPVRHGRMAVSPFTFYRGAAKIMAADLKDTPRAGLDVQLCGDAHLSNFGVYASPERTLLFDLNDFDETLPGPFEYDVARLVGELRDRRAEQRLRAGRCTSLCHWPRSRRYRTAMQDFAGMRTLDIWYSRARRRGRARHRHRGGWQSASGRPRNGRRRGWRRRGPRTACRPSRSSPRSSMATTAS